MHQFGDSTDLNILALLLLKGVVIVGKRTFVPWGLPLGRRDFVF